MFISFQRIVKYSKLSNKVHVRVKSNCTYLKTHIKNENSDHRAGRHEQRIPLTFLPRFPIPPLITPCNNENFWVVFTRKNLEYTIIVLLLCKSDIFYNILLNNHNSLRWCIYWVETHYWISDPREARRAQIFEQAPQRMALNVFSSLAMLTWL